MTAPIAADNTSPIAPSEMPPPRPEDARAIEIGTVLNGRYLIERAIGSGGMSTVFCALDRHRAHGPDADGRVAIKILNRATLSDKGRLRRLVREFRYMQRLTHHGITRVFDLDCDDGTWFMTMELLQGETLSSYLQRRVPPGLPTDEALRILAECTEALVFAHDHGVIHGDLKPGNIFIDQKGVTHLLDFGSVPEPGEVEERRDRFVTPAYASPQLLEEQLADVRDDLFSLGCVAYELFTGQHPFGLVSSQEARRDQLRLVWARSIPARHFGAISRMLSWDRDERPGSAHEFLDSLRAVLARSRTVHARETTHLFVVPGAEAQAGNPDPSGIGNRGEPPKAPPQTREPDRQTSKVKPLLVSDAGEDSARASARPSVNVTALAKGPPMAAPVPDISPKKLQQTSAETLEEKKPTPAVPRAVRWITQLTHGSARRHDPAPHPPTIRIAETAVRSGGPEPVAPAPAAIRRPDAPWDLSQLPWIAPAMVGWTAIATRLRALRHGPSSHPFSQGQSPAQANNQATGAWTPQLHWHQEMTMSWSAVEQPPSVISQVRLGSFVVTPSATPVAASAAIDSWRAPAQWWGNARALASGEPASSGKTPALLPHWIRLRRSMRSLATSLTPEKKSRIPGLSWWREVAPAVGLVGVGVAAWMLLQFADESRSAATSLANAERIAALRLEKLANAPVAITLPLIASPEPSGVAEENRPVPGPAPAPGQISFQAARIHVSAGQELAVVNLLRNHSTRGTAPFGWQIAAGTARPGIDYELPKSQVARFNDGQDVRTLFIPIKQSKAEARPERRFTIKLTKTPGAPAFGAITETEIVIAGSG